MTKAAAPQYARKTIIPKMKCSRPCSWQSLRQVFHEYGSPCKTAASFELSQLMERDLKQIVVLALGFAKAQGRRSLQSKHVAKATEYYLKRYRPQDPSILEDNDDSPTPPETVPDVSEPANTKKAKKSKESNVPDLPK